MTSQESSILTDANATVNGRDKGYGDPVDTAERVANAFVAITGRQLRPSDVALVQILFKQIRSEHEYKRDNMLDAAGYTEIRERCLIKEKEALLELELEPESSAGWV